MNISKAVISWQKKFLLGEYLFFSMSSSSAYVTHGFSINNT